MHIDLHTYYILYSITLIILNKKWSQWHSGLSVHRVAGSSLVKVKLSKDIVTYTLCFYDILFIHPNKHTFYM